MEDPRAEEAPDESQSSERNTALWVRVLWLFLSKSRAALFALRHLSVGGVEGGGGFHLSEGRKQEKNKQNKKQTKKAEISRD